MDYVLIRLEVLLEVIFEVHALTKLGHLSIVPNTVLMVCSASCLLFVKTNRTFQITQHQANTTLSPMPVYSAVATTLSAAKATPSHFAIAKLETVPSPFLET
jgi:hypothetical protein